MTDDETCRDCGQKTITTDRLCRTCKLAELAFGPLTTRKPPPDEYMPTTEAVRQRYAMQEPVTDLLQAEFDRWLVEHDREVAAKAWDEGYEAGQDDEAFTARGMSADSDAAEYPHGNPYRLRVHATKEREGATEEER